MLEVKNAQERSSVKVLALDGGGARGMFTIAFLAQIEEFLAVELKQPKVNIGHYFDLITGTSIGGILSLGLAAGKNARELSIAFRTHAPKIFPPLKHSWFLKGVRNYLIRSRRPQYTTEPLVEAIKSMIPENLRFNDLTRRVMVPAVNLTTGNPQFFKTPHKPGWTRDGNLTLLDAALSTSAAPTYFKPHYCEDLNAYFADGGLIANSPAFVGLHEILLDMTSDFPQVDIKDVKILNIGTAGGEYCLNPSTLETKREKGYLGLWGVGGKLLETTMVANQTLHKVMLQRQLAGGNASENYVNIDSNIPNEAAADITLDNASKAALDHLEARAKQIAHEEWTKNEQLKAFFNVPRKPFEKQA